MGKITQDVPTTEILSTKTNATQVDDHKAFREAFAISNRHKKRSNLMGALAILNNYVVWTACIAVCEHVQTHYPSNRALWWATYIPAVLVVSSRLRACEHLVHESSHNNLFTNPRVHDYVEFLYAFPVFRIMKVFRVLHLEHHKYIGDPVRDADVVRFIHYGFICSEEKKMSRTRWWWNVYGLPLTGWFHYEYMISLFAEFWTSPLSYPSKVIYWASVLATVHFFDVWKGFAIYYLVAMFGILPVTRWWAELGEHLGQDMTKSFGNSRTNDGFWQRWWIHPLNDGLHAAHHLNSQIPCYRLRKAHTELMEEVEEFRTKNTFSNGMFETFQQGYNEPTIIKDSSEGKAEWNNGRQIWSKM